MRARDMVSAFSLPLIFLITLYFYTRNPVVYRPPNSISKMHSGQNLNIVFFGDSITSGYGEKNNYVYLFRMRLKNTSAFDHTKVFNEGFPGERTADGLLRIDSDVISNKPDLVYILFGGNDLKDRVPLSEFENNLRQMVKRIQDGAHSEIVLMTLPIFDIPLTKNAIKQYNEVIRRVAKDMNIGCLDIYKTYDKQIGWFGSASDYYQTDHIHPNQKGHQLIYQDIWQTLE